MTIRTPRLQEARIGVRMRAKANNVEQSKFAFYNPEFAVCDGELCPMGLEPVGAMGPAGVGFIRLMAQAMAKPGSDTYQVFLRELSLTRVSVSGSAQGKRDGAPLGSSA